MKPSRVTQVVVMIFLMHSSFPSRHAKPLEHRPVRLPFGAIIERRQRCLYTVYPIPTLERKLNQIIGEVGIFGQE